MAKPKPVGEAPHRGHDIAWQACRNLCYPLTRAEIADLLVDEIKRFGISYRAHCLWAILKENEEK